MSPPRRAVPWTCFAEWKWVAEAAFTLDNPIKLKKAIDIMQIWCIRGNHPPAVESTLNLLKLTYSLDHGLIDERSARLSLSSIIIRLVNEAVDPGQKGTHALPVSHLAEKINLPRLLVDIRHNATHDELPSLETLLLASKMGYYWDTQASYEDNIRQTTLAMLDRFSQAARDCDPLTRPVERIVPGFINDFAHLESSQEIQTPFLYTILDSKYSVDEVKPLLLEIMRRDDSFFVSVFAVAIDIEKSQGNRSVSFSKISEVFTLLLPIVKENSTWAHCVKAALLSDSSWAMEKLKQLISSPQFPQDLRSLVEMLASNKPLETSQSIEELLSKGDDIMQGGIHNYEESVPEGWQLAEDWKPCPFGITRTFNAARDFKILYDIKD